MLIRVDGAPRVTNCLNHALQRLFNRNKPVLRDCRARLYHEIKVITLWLLVTVISNVTVITYSVKRGVTEINVNGMRRSCPHPQPPVDQPLRIG